MTSPRVSLDGRLDERKSRLINVSETPPHGRVAVGARRLVPPKPHQLRQTLWYSTPVEFLAIPRKPADSYVLTSYRCLTLIVTVS